MTKAMFCIFCLSLLNCFCLYAQEQPEISVRDLQIVFINDEEIEVSFIAESSKHASKNGYTYIYAPRITNNNAMVSLKPIVVRSRLADIAWKRHEWAADTLLDVYKAFTIKNGEVLEYKSTVPLQAWMYESSIEVQEVVPGYGVERSNVYMLAEQAIPPYEPDPVARVVYYPVRNPQLSVGDSLAYIHPYLYPDSVACADNLLSVFENERTAYPSVYFANSGHAISPAYKNNEQVLEEYLTVLKTIENAADTKITKIVVAGFSSPVGAYTFNDLLAWRRAISLKRFVVDNIDIPVDSVFILNGSADWIGLRETIMADDSIPNEARAERIVKKEIKNGRDLERRIRQLRRTRGGRPYKHLQQTKGFENLNRAYIRVYYKSGLDYTM